MVELVAEHGYNAVAVATLTNRARVSKRDFYKHFAGKDECFLATYDIIVSQSVRGILAAAEGEDEWHERLRLGFLAFAGQIAASPDAARLALVEVFAAGAVAVERMLRASRLFEALVAKNFALADGPPQLPQLVVKGIVAGAGRMARARLLSGEPRQLAVDGDELMEWALSFCDDDAVRLRGLGVSGAPPPATAAEIPLEDERALILAATAKLASKEGYATLTVPRVRAAAGVSRGSFDSHFEGVADCFLATLEMLSGRTLAAAAPLYLIADDWASGVHRMIVGLCQHLACDATFTGLAFLEVFSPGPEAIQWRSEMIAKLATMLRRGAPPKRQPSRFAAEASVGAMWGVIHHFVASGRGAQLPIAAPALSYIALAPALGGAAAVDVILTEVGGEGDADVAVAAVSQV
ncbi:MAG TPA: TetR/AcrR family transcriptional regulator [Solirubrobacterales bacterium]|jgi:AcrR family transcriptional regulator|nr:TetR/AcrR family transcriptional regulator [Solirubrobacterales bacterium]